ncbi:hypothetical protein LCGC14_3053980 [marine sediment metagenome]|uniref:High potential iron-sulfur proteins family profile domain-containing protein n=1 Tax=marine sediment metagenome TaxID=412755 RepID=A0A0F8WKV6_9ZZZZ
MNTRARARTARQQSNRYEFPLSRLERTEYHREKRMQDASYMDMKISKRDARYRPDTEGDPCSSCEFFARPDACIKVEGSISPKATCDLYEWDGDSGLRSQSRAFRE